MNRDELQNRMGQVMIRNRREDADIDFTDRIIDTRTFEPSAAEMDLYDSVSDYVREAYSQDQGQKLVLMLLQKEVVSSPAALEQTIRMQLEDRNELTHRDELRTILDKIEAISPASGHHHLGFPGMNELRDE